MKVGRNDPCPCGSGKKYKHCCLPAAAPPETETDLIWRRARRALDGYATRMLRFVLDAYGPDVLDEAWEGFSVLDEGGFDPETPHMQVFMPWLFHCWSPDPFETGVMDESLHGVIPTAAFLERKGRHVDAVLRRYLESCLNEPFSFLEIVRSDPGTGFRARDVITGDEYDIQERSASRSATEGDIIFAQLAHIDGIVMLEGTSLLPIPPIRKVDIIGLRTHINAGCKLSSREALRDWDLELIGLYVKLLESMLERRLPALQNTDGEDLSMQRLIFDVDSTQEAFDALKRLALGEPDEDLLAKADRDSQGALVRVSFIWRKEGNRLHKSWSNTSLGEIEIDGQRLVAHVNSAERAARFRKIVEDTLGERARYRAAEIQSMERLLAEAGTQSSNARAARDAEQAALAELPEVKAYMAAMMAKHYEQWVTEPIPALGGITPLDAVKSPDGREMVEALVAQIERGSGGLGSPVDVTIVAGLRERLGIARAAAKD